MVSLFKDRESVVYSNVMFVQKPIDQLKLLKLSEEQRQRALEIFEELIGLWGEDPRLFYNIATATTLGLMPVVSKTGCDAFDEITNNPYEIKNTISSELKGAYTGISNPPTISSLEEKFGTGKHAYSRWKKGKLQEVWEMPAEKAVELLKSKILYSDFSDKKDPRPSANFSDKEIRRNGNKIYG